MKILKKLSFGALVLASTGCSAFGVRSEESPLYEVVQKSGNKEIRKYETYVVASTTVRGPYEEAQTKAFRILADYIFGNNDASDSIAMTAPVMQKPQGEGTQIAMTAPVMQVREDQGWTMSFMMPSKYSLKDLPSPRSSQIKLEQVSERYMAAIRYSWGRSEAKNREQGNELVQWLEQETPYQPASELISAGYDPPWTLPFLRRNEMLVEVQKPASK